MSTTISVLCTLVISLTVLVNSIVMFTAANFTDLFQSNWSPDHIFNQADLTILTLDSVSGCGFESKKKYLYGKASVQLKLVEGDSAGTVTAFYMSSDGIDNSYEQHDELDFEFLGNVSGEPYLVQTNVYVNGTGNREQRHTLWFDPTSGFHTYSFFWNQHSIVFLVDGIPIRVFTNMEENGIPYPKNQAMGIRGSVWNADDWATQGGMVKTNWSHAPFISTFRAFEIDACELLPGLAKDFVAECGELGRFWWNKPSMNELNKHKKHQLKWVRAKHLVYDYCMDKTRFVELPRECTT